MLLLKQIQWFSFKTPNSLKVCLFSSPLHNLKHSCLHGKLFYFCNLFNIMRTKSSKIKIHLSKRLKLQMMAAITNSKCNKDILKTDSLKDVQVGQCSSRSPSSIPSTRSEQENARSRRKESIKSDKSNNEKKFETNSPSKRSKETVSFNVNSLQRQTNVPNSSVPVINDRTNCNYRNMPVMYPHLVYRSFSDSRIQQQQLNLVYLNNNSSSHSNYNRYRMRRSNTVDTPNRTTVAERDRQLAWSLRTWQRTTFGKKFEKQRNTPMSCNFTIMSYNVLAQELLTEHSYLYRNHNPRALLWEQRWNNLLEEIKQHKADILCLQEVQASHLESYFSELKKLGYEGLFKQRTGVRTDGCAIYYKTSVFNLVEHTTVEFNQTNIPVLNRDNVAIIAKFSPKQNRESEFVVATTHLLYNPKREDVRLAQTQVLLSEVDRISFKKNNVAHAHLPIIITGDFNLTPNSAVYELITHGILQYEHLTNRSLARTNTTFANATGKFLLPSSLRITDECQHADIVDIRKESSAFTREEELKLIQLEHSERNSSNKCSKKIHNSWFSTGTLSHHLALKSAYDHRYGDAVEATTFQDQWVTVDYIFYSGVRDQSDLIKEDKLKLISRYTIPSSQQLEGIQIPNFAFGSDHLSLVVKFKLNP